MRKSLLKDIERCFHEKSTFKKEIEYTFKTTKEKKFLNVKYGYVPDDKVVITTEDFTERKMTETALKESEAKYRLISVHPRV